ncbi:unannotated protein [freshwater metagenome]|uniref:Unannotated protein n=1 Tax=freshwater metagenome TaxID=449393 RepID=A0A6J7K1Z4_9ZZZZ|nr:bifunctional folylpolyglutamate synthase/dihydrofolate synthase [Actinomycetota bacterium]
MDYSTAIKWLDSHVNLETGLGIPAGVDRRLTAPTLERITALTTLLGSPQLEFPSIHLTGTNGKTSTARILTALLVAEGLNVGSFTSPHLETVRERINLNGDVIGESELAALLTRVATVETFLDDAPSYFEILVAAAFDWFAEVAVDVAVVEVGLGGRWDATNVLSAPISVITNVGLDHTEYLGETVEEIATEKAGIIEVGSTLVLGSDQPNLAQIFIERDPLRTFTAGREFSVLSDRLAMGGRLVDIATPLFTYRDIFLSLNGPHQALNAATALCSAELFLGSPLSTETVEEAFGSVRSPGRLEVVGRSPLVILDGAHNPDGLRSLRAALEEGFSFRARTYVVGAMRGRDVDDFFAALAPNPETDRVICTKAQTNRALDPEALAEAALRYGLGAESVLVIPDVGDALGRAIKDAGVDDQIVVTGSLYVVGAARSSLPKAR